MASLILRPTLWRALCCALMLCAAAPAWASAGSPPRPDADNVPGEGLLQSAFQCTGRGVWTFKPGSVQATRHIATGPALPWDLRSAAVLRVRAKTIHAQRQAVRLRWLVHSHLGGMYAAAQTATVAAAGDPTIVEVRLQPGDGDLVPVGHQRPWDALAAAEVTRLELRAEITGADTQVKVALTDPLLEPFVAEAGTSEPRLLDLAWVTPPSDINAAVEVRFRLDPLPADPFDYKGPGDVRVKTSAGEALAFLDQRYYTVADGTASRSAPIGLPFFRAYLPKAAPGDELTIQSGTHTWTVKIQSPANSTAAHKKSKDAPPLETALPRWTVDLDVPLTRTFDPTSQGLWAGAPQAWKWTGGAAGHWKVVNPPEAQRAWRPILFWTAQWGSFGSLRRPDFALAHRLDEALARAHRDARAQPLILLDGETFSRHGTFTWHSHPLNTAQGGFLVGPGEMMSHEAGVHFCRRVARYALARWGRSHTVNGFVMNVTLNAPAAADLHARLAATVGRWPLIAGGEKALVSLHPLAQEPLATVPVEGLGALGRAGDGLWQAGEPLPQSTKVVLQGGLGDDAMRASMEMLTPGAKGSVCAQKVFIVPGSDYRKPSPDDFHSADALMFDVWLPSDAPADLRAGVHVRDRDELWYQTLLPGLLRPGEWTRCLVDVRGENRHGFKPVRHKKTWTDYTRGRLREIGLHVYTTHTQKPLVVRFANVKGVRYDRAGLAPPRHIALLTAPPKTAAKGTCWRAHLSINHTYANPFDPTEVDLAALITTPSGRTVRVPAFFDQPAKRTLDKKGRERITPIGSERWTVRYRVLEEGAHRVRFELREGGRYETVEKKMMRDTRFSNDGRAFPAQPRNKDDWVYRYQEHDQTGRRLVERVRFKPGRVVTSTELPGVAFSASKSGEPWKGFVRTSADGRHFSYDNGDFYYALGPCLRSPSDNRLPYDDPKWNDAFLKGLERRGTYQYDDYFSSFEKAGINWARVWMCSWWGALQWRRDWPGYQGYGRYNLLNAWRMDHVLDEAEKRGICISLCLTNHGQFSYVIDTEWQHNPYNTKLGGPLATPREFFTQREAQIAHMNMLRYTLARWSHSPAVMAWDLFSELEFTDEYRNSIGDTHRGRADAPAPHLEEWHVYMARYLKENDPNRHLVATHFSHPIRGKGVFSLDDIDVATSNAYSAFDELAGGKNDAAAALADFWGGSNFGGGVFRGFRIFQKPVLVEEQGRHWMGVEIVHKHGQEIKKRHNNKNNLDADLHAGLWGSMVQPLAGATGYWWWLHVHFDDRYFEYQALAKYLKGEDLRPGRNERTLDPVVVPVLDRKKDLRARALKSDRRAYVWIYHQQTPLRSHNIPRVDDATLYLTQLQDGVYKIEYWDTREGRVLKTERATAERQLRNREQGAILTLKLPTIFSDVALKVIKIGEAPAPKLEPDHRAPRR